MVVKSLEELKTLSDSLQKKINLRKIGEISDYKTIEILVSMGTSGIASGARETFNKLLEVINEKDLKTVKVIGVDCMGYQHAEPTVQVTVPGNEPLIYGKITEDKVEALINSVAIKGQFFNEKHLIKFFNKAVV